MPTSKAVKELPAGKRVVKGAANEKKLKIIVESKAEQECCEPGCGPSTCGT